VRRMSCGECVEACIGEERRMSEDAARAKMEAKVADLDGKTVGTFLIDEFIAQEERMLETIGMALGPHMDREVLGRWTASRRHALNVFRQSVQAAR
jgi:hypothetical protein